MDATVNLIGPHKDSAGNLIHQEDQPTLATGTNNRGNQWHNQQVEPFAKSTSRGGTKKPGYEEARMYACWLQKPENKSTTCILLDWTKAQVDKLIKHLPVK